MKRKILFITITYIIGILWGLYFNINIVLFLCMIIVIIILLLKRKFFMVVLLVVVLISEFRSNSIKKIYDNVYFENDQVIVTGEVIKKYENNDSNYEKYLIKISTIDGKRDYKNFHLYMYMQDKNESLIVGEFIKVEGTFYEGNESRNFNGFNYNEYLRTEKIIGIIKEKDVQIIDLKKHMFFHNLLDNLRKNVKEKIYKMLPQKEANLCIALILGNKDLINDEITEYFSKSLLTYILAISGMHISYIISFFSLLLEKLGKNKKNIILCCLLIFYNILVGYEISILRATIMNCMYIIGSLLYRKPNSIANLSLSAIVALIINPYSIKSFSFIFSFGGTLGIIIFYQKIEHYLLRIPIIKSTRKEMEFIRKSISLSVSANIIILPFIIYFFNRASIIFIVSSIIANILLTIIIPLILISIFTSFVSIPISKIISIVLKIFLNLLILFSKIFSNDLFNINMITPYKFSIIIYYIVTSLIFFRSNSEKVIKNIINKYIKNVLIIYLSFILIVMIRNKINKDLNIYFIDVGQGDSTLIITENGKTILVDSGGSELGEDKVGKNTLLPYLLDRRITELDYIMISHFDSDHCGAMLYIMEKLKVKNAIISKQGEESDNYNKFIQIVSEKKINTIVVSSGMKINIDKNTYFDIIWPSKDLVQENVLNNNSIVAKLNYKSFSILFTGDIEEVVEKKLIYKYDLSSNIIKISHHGSKTSSSLEFIKCVNPKIALIGVGENNKFGHPSDVTINTIKSVECRIYRTDLDGEISININNYGKIRIKKQIN